MGEWKGFGSEKKEKEGITDGDVTACVERRRW